MPWSGSVSFRREHSNCVSVQMNFRKVRKRKQEGALTRSWERGFLSADCGDMAKDDIGYLPLYKPDIEGQGEAVCDYVFNETVVAYSHENIRNFGQMVTDYMNVWSMMWLSGVSQQSKDISFLNIDAIKKGKYFGDLPNQFFKCVSCLLRRFLSFTLCFIQELRSVFQEDPTSC